MAKFQETLLPFFSPLLLTLLVPHYPIHNPKRYRNQTYNPRIPQSAKEGIEKGITHIKTSIREGKIFSWIVFIKLGIPTQLLYKQHIKEQGMISHNQKYGKL
jgi:hypothetical protein